MISVLLPLVGIGGGHEIKLGFFTTLLYAMKKTCALLERYKNNLTSNREYGKWLLKMIKLQSKLLVVGPENR